MFEYLLLKKSEHAKWIVFLHGFGGSEKTWQDQVDFFSNKYNLLILNLHKTTAPIEPLTPDNVSDGIYYCLKKEAIVKAHFIGMSSGALLLLWYAARYPDTVEKMIMPGGMISFSNITKCLLNIALFLKGFVPYPFIYNFFAYLLMPGRNHIKSRRIFVRESKKLGQLEFSRWVELIPMLLKNQGCIQTINKTFEEEHKGQKEKGREERKKRKSRILFVMGSNDHLFLPQLYRDIVRMENADIRVIEGCGHVCSIESPDIFNDMMSSFID